MNVYILHMGGANTGKAVVLRTNNRAGSKAFKAEACELCNQYGGKYVTVERTGNDLKTKYVGPCEILNA